MLNRKEDTVVSWENDKTSTARLLASARLDATSVTVSAQTPETSVAFRISRGSLRELADFLAAVADEVDTWEDVTEQPDTPADGAEGTVA